ncbi:hypothetical protein BLNAU_3359 [Blattamonas nauphoetae]|uniref:SPRY domain-containing protein n=1 Tax=Blattamonas nauphoetae TaxID=2049346 RepID=A0ABQ9YCR9_9EUKA|nr:hypothetical protein BLNAU_3359 [Blattamonas nauphoetae]
MTIHYVSSIDAAKQFTSSPSLPPNSVSESSSPASIPKPSPLLALPPLIFVDRSHFVLNDTTLTRSEVDLSLIGCARSSAAIVRNPITAGVLSIIVTILSLPTLKDCTGGLRFGVVDSTAPIPELDEAIGTKVKNSISLSASHGCIASNTPSTHNSTAWDLCHSKMNEGDCIRIELDMDSSPRTVQFFVNGQRGLSFVSGLPRSIRVGFSVFVQGTSFRIDRITTQIRSTPLPREMKEIKW